jgi:hypothetical protein
MLPNPPLGHTRRARAIGRQGSPASIVLIRWRTPGLSKSRAAAIIDPAPSRLGRSLMQLLSDRQRNLITLARTLGRVSVDDPSARFDVTLQTIRRDLNELCKRRVLTRTHGGAVVSSCVENLSYDARRFIAAAEKKATGIAAAALIPNKSPLFINIGTTAEEVAAALANHDALLVIANNLNVAMTFYRRPCIEVIVAALRLAARTRRWWEVPRSPSSAGLKSTRQGSGLGSRRGRIIARRRRGRGQCPARHHRIRPPRPPGQRSHEARAGGARPHRPHIADPHFRHRPAGFRRPSPSQQGPRG